MALHTFSSFIYGHFIDNNNRFLNFDEGSGEISGELNPNSYTFSEFISQVQTVLNGIGANTYSVTADRSTRLVTISSDSTFDLLVSTGSQIGQGVFELLGFTGADRTGQTSYTGNIPSGFLYEPQFKLQDYIPKELSTAGISTVINKNAEGAVEIVTFGREQFIECNIRYISDLPQDGKLIKNNPQGLAQAIHFLNDITEKRRFEFIPDIDSPDVYSKVILESIPGFNNGTGFRLRSALAIICQVIMILG